MTRRRADAALAETGLFPSRERARAAIMAGRVRVDGEVIRKPGQPVADDVAFVVAAEPEYVSRGGHKLAGALDAFGVRVSGVDAVDVGASTGGFTDCLLRRGAASVTAVDVGYGQLAWSLRIDERVRVVERTNIRNVDGDLPGSPFDLAVVDVSFVGLAKVLPAVATLLREDACVLALVKPQFEAGKGRVGKRGVVRDPRVHEDVLGEVLTAVTSAGWSVHGLTWSPIAGPEGNIEFWVRLARGGASEPVDRERVVREAHDALGAR